MVLKAPRELQFAELDLAPLAEDQVRVRVTHSAICGTDLKIYKGDIPVRHPLIMGHEMCGEVAEGEDSLIHRGDRVMIDPSIYCGTCFCCHAGRTSICPNGVLLGRDRDGGFAEYLAVPRRQIFALPQTVDSRQAPAIQVATTCLHGQRMLNIFPGQSVVVLGLGVSGQIHVQLAKARGAYPVIGVTRSAWKRSLAEKLGADITVASGAEAERLVIEATGGRGADVVIESTGILPSLASGISMARRGGMLLPFGIITVTEGKLPFYQLYFKELTIVNARAAKSEDFPATIDLVARGMLNLQALVTHVVGLSELESAIHMLDSDADERMKIILDHAN
jgi:2-desacetyl-2-hydroxyethyl bacteriochlorophyllide A dehydrogenase